MSPSRGKQKRHFYVTETGSALMGSKPALKFKEF
jgi:hypothetical protein